MVSRWKTTCHMTKNYKWNFFLRHNKTLLNSPKSRKIKTDFRETRTSQKTKLFLFVRQGDRDQSGNEIMMFLLYLQINIQTSSTNHISSHITYPFRLLFENDLNLVIPRAPAIWWCCRLGSKKTKNKFRNFDA